MIRTAMVTGGSRGIGKAICLKLASRGYHVIVNYFGEENAADGNEVARLCSEMGTESIAVEGDISKEEDCINLVNAGINGFGSIDVLVNNAGITRDNLVVRMGSEDFDAVINTNLKGAFLCSKAVTRPMMKQRFGRIVNISSVVGLFGNPGQANYSAAKAGMIGMTKSMAKELAPRNITVNAVAPGFIDTEMTKSLPDNAKESLLSAVPMAKPGAPEDVANAVAFLVSEESSYITGQILCVDGGMAM